MNQKLDLELISLTKRYGATVAVDAISYHLDAGTYACLLGPSGCGKSSTLRMIAGHETVSDGAVTLGGRDISHLSPAKRGTAMMFQNYALFPHMSVAQNIAFGLEMLGKPKAEIAATVDEMLRLARMEALKNRRTSETPGGQQQRVALARALAPHPEVLLLDEPLSALDLKLRKEMQIELKRLQNETGITFIFVTHDQEEALIMSDRVAVMFDGAIAQLADPQRLYKRPRTRKVGDFIGVMNFLPAHVTDPNRITLDVAGLGAVTIAPEQAPSGTSSGAAEIGIRPEMMSILFEGEPDRGEIAEATIQDRAYYGDMTYYDVHLKNVPEPVTISMKNIIGRPVLEVGETTRVSWDARSLVLFAS